MVDHAPQRVPDIALHPHSDGVVAAQFLRVDVELDDRRSLWRDAVSVGHLSPGVTADEEDQICLADGLVGAVSRVGTGDAHR